MSFREQSGNLNLFNIIKIKEVKSPSCVRDDISERLLRSAYDDLEEKLLRPA